jgi:TusA-related sulfurtransferase
LFNDKIKWRRLLAQGGRSVQPKKRLDITADACPVTLVRALLALEELAGGDILEVQLASGEAAKNVPRSLACGGHKILSLKQKDEGIWLLYVEKCGGERIAE